MMKLICHENSLISLENVRRVDKNYNDTWGVYMIKITYVDKTTEVLDFKTRENEMKLVFGRIVALLEQP